MLQASFCLVVAAALSTSALATAPFKCRVEPISSGTRCAADVNELPLCHNAIKGEACLQRSKKCIVENAHVNSECEAGKDVYRVVEPFRGRGSHSEANTLQSTWNCNASDINGDSDRLKTCIQAYYSAKAQNTGWSQLPIEDWNTNGVSSLAYAFWGSVNVTEDLSNWDTSSVDTLLNAFYGAKHVTANLAGWDTSEVYELWATFKDAEDVDLDLRTWNVERVYDFDDFCAGCKRVTLDTSTWAPPVKYMDRFADKGDLMADLSSFNTSGLVGIDHAFEESTFNGDISNWDTSSVEYMHQTFKGSQFNGDISKWDTSSLYDIGGIFELSQFNGDISKWKTSGVQYMDKSFMSSQFNGDISKWDTSSVRYMDRCFMRSQFNGDISNWDVRKVMNFRETFRESFFSVDISKWITASMLVADSMFEGSSVTTAPIWDTRQLLSANNLFANMTTFDADLHNVRCWQTPHLESADNMFAGTDLDPQNHPDWLKNVSNTSAMLRSRRCVLEAIPPPTCTLEVVDASECPVEMNFFCNRAGIGEMCEWSPGSCGNGSNALDNCGGVYDMYRVLSRSHSMCPLKDEDPHPSCSIAKEGQLCEFDWHTCGNGTNSLDNCGELDVYRMVDGDHLNMTLADECVAVAYHVTTEPLTKGSEWVSVAGDLDDWECPINITCGIHLNPPDGPVYEYCGVATTTARPNSCSSNAALVRRAVKETNHNTGQVYLHLTESLKKNHDKGTTILKVNTKFAQPASPKKKKKDDNTVMIVLIVVGSLVAVVGILLLARKMSGNGAGMNAGKTNLLL